jgi:hypothetical protein
MSKEPVLDRDWRDLYRNVSNVFRKGVLRAPGPDEDGRTPADRVLGVSPEQRRAIVGAVLVRERAARETHVLADPEPTPWSAYEVMNSITAAARDEAKPQRRMALEELAGRLVDDYRPLPN